MKMMLIAVVMTSVLAATKDPPKKPLCCCVGDGTGHLVCEPCKYARAERLRVREMLRAQRKNRNRWVPHITCSGARFHVLSWHGGRRLDGTFAATCVCSEPRC